MKQDGTYREYGCIEQRLSQIGAKIANATDLSRKAKELASRSESTLISAQKEIEALYISLGRDGSPEASEPDADL
ncbi:MAG: hypothetical protein AAGU32_03420 [Bacillota bacterium]